jgi:pimeloyl-ACP methyl ester carboxylesterase
MALSRWDGECVWLLWRGDGRGITAAASGLGQEALTGRKKIVAGALAGIVFYQLPDAVREDYLSGYEGGRMVESMRYVRRYPDELPILRDLLPSTTTPAQIIAGGRDWAVPPVNGYFLAGRLPDSRLDILNAGHFTWEDAPRSADHRLVAEGREASVVPICARSTVVQSPTRPSPRRPGAAGSGTPE